MAWNYTYSKIYTPENGYEIIVRFIDGARQVQRSWYFQADPTVEQIRTACNEWIGKQNQAPPSGWSPITAALDAAKEELKWAAINYIRKNPTKLYADIAAAMTTELGEHKAALLPFLVYQYGVRGMANNLLTFAAEATTADIYLALRDYVAAAPYDQLVKALEG